MCDQADLNGKLTGLAGRFIAETNAFLARYWGDSIARWPLRPRDRPRSPPACCRPRRTDVPIADATPSVAPTANHADRAAELLAQLTQYCRFIGPADGNGDGEPDGDVYLILVIRSGERIGLPDQKAFRNADIPLPPASSASGENNQGGNGAGRPRTGSRAVARLGS